MTAPSTDSRTQPYVSVVLPTYNERENIVPLIRRIMAVMTDPYEIIVVDDDSPDGTAGNVSKAFLPDEPVRLIVRKNEKGLASAIRCGIDSARGDIVVWMDCDLAMPPEKIPDLVRPVSRGVCDAAVGSRYCRGGKDLRSCSGQPLLWWHTLFSLLLCRCASYVLRSDFRDWTSGFIAVRREIVQEIPFQGYYGEFFIALIYAVLSRGYKVDEIPYRLTHRLWGHSKTAQTVPGLLKRGFTYLSMIARVKWKRNRLQWNT